GRARLQPRDLHLGLEARRGLLQRELQLVLEILAARRARAARATAAAQEVLEDVLEQRAEAGVEAAAGRRPRRGPEAVVVRTLVGIREDGVRLVDLLEFLLGVLVALVLVRVVLHGQGAERLLDLGLARLLRDAEDLVVVASHLRRRPRRARRRRRPW